MYRCDRCGKHGYKSEHCAAPRRFEDTCGACGQYGHIWWNCALSSRGQPHLNVFTSSGECPVTDAHGADTIVIPQQQHYQPAVDLGGEDIPFQQSSARQQQLDLQHNGGVVETSGAPGGGSGGYGEDGSGPLSGTFFGGDGGAVEEWLQSDNMKMTMFSLSEGPQQLAPTAVGLAAAAPAAEAVIGTRVFPDVSSKGVAEGPTSSAGAGSAAVPAAAPAIGGTVFPTASVGGAARAPASADGTAASMTAPATSGTVPSAAPIRGAVGARESTAGATSSGAAAEAAPSTGDTAAPDASVARAARKLASAAGSSSEICDERGASTHPFDPGTVSATTTAAGCSMAVAAAVTAAAAAAAAATTTPATTTHGGMQPVLEHYCDPLIRGNDAGGVRGEERRFSVWISLLTAGKLGGGCSMKGNGFRAEGEFLVLFGLCRERLENRVLETALVSCCSAHENHDGENMISRFSPQYGQICCPRRTTGRTLVVSGCSISFLMGIFAFKSAKVEVWF